MSYDLLICPNCRRIFDDLVAIEGELCPICKIGHLKKFEEGLDENKD